MENLFWSNSIFRRNKSDVLHLLKSVPVFESLDSKELSKISKILHQRHWEIGEEGRPDMGMHIILRGVVEIREISGVHNTIQLNKLGAGDFFGEQTLLDDSPRTATVTAVETCTTFGFFRPDILEIVESDPRLGLKIVTHLAQMLSIRLRHTNVLLKQAVRKLTEIPTVKY
jgi:CRP/FNR family cyclic AMP-dependent transcriptional regulator